MAATLNSLSRNEKIPISPCSSPRVNFGRARYLEKYISVKRPNPDKQKQQTNEGVDFVEESMPNLIIYCRIYNPSYIHSSESPPLLVVHGGPLLPSDYLFPLVQHLPKTRSIVFYDQLGCGKSSRPANEKMYSMQNSVEDLETVIQYLELDKFHLLGHSFGGDIAYEYLKCQLNKHSLQSEEKNDFSSRCLSLILANAPADMTTSVQEYERLESEIKSEMMLENDAESAQDETSLNRDAHDRLWRRNECRTQLTPDPLAKAIHSRGEIWSSPEAVADYVARPPMMRSPSSLSATDARLPPVLLIRGEFDFVTEKCIRGWRLIFENKSVASCPTGCYREELMLGCAHYCHLEDEQEFGNLVQNHCFINDY